MSTSLNNLQSSINERTCKDFNITVQHATEQPWNALKKKETKKKNFYLKEQYGRGNFYISISNAVSHLLVLFRQHLKYPERINHRSVMLLETQTNFLLCNY